jgi:hypothetical protein
MSWNKYWQDCAFKGFRKMKFILSLITTCLIQVPAGSQVTNIYFPDIVGSFNVGDGLDNVMAKNIQSSSREMISEEMMQWLRNEAAVQLSGCKMSAHDGTILYTPDGEGNYAALWTRDFGYMVENAIDILPLEDVRKAIVYLLNGQRSDGCIPDRVQADGLAVYSAGPVGKPLGDPPSDNSQFMVKLVSDYVSYSKDLEFFKQVSPGLIKAMNYTPRRKNGLVYIDPQNPHSPYGFTDTIQKTGELLFSSLLYWEACQKLMELFNQIDNLETVNDFRSRSLLIEKNLSNLWDDQAGMFLAASVDCRQTDIWGNAYAIYIGYPLAEKKKSIIDFLAKNYNAYVYKGQIRHLTEPDCWQKTLITIRPGEYQNGAFWGTASGWVGYALADQYPRLAKEIYVDLIAFYQQNGPYECVNVNYLKLDNYVASVVNPLGAAKKIKDINFNED